jgi:hypothetical protein
MGSASSPEPFPRRGLESSPGLAEPCWDESSLADVSPARLAPSPKLQIERKNSARV